MKALKILLVGLWFAMSASAQTVTPNPGPYQNISTKYQYTWQKWSGGIWNLGKLVQADSALFSGITYVPNAPAGDSSNEAANTGWIKRNIAPGTPGQPVLAWAYRGNYTDAEPTQGRLGFIDSVDLHFITDNGIRLTIPSEGINRNGGAANKVLMIDTVTKKLYYADAGTGGGGSGTVTNVASGYGLLGGPITTTGTLEVDSTLFATQYDLTTGLAGKVNISDTAAMNANFVRRVHAGTNVTVDNTDPRNPVVSASGGAGGLPSNVVYLSQQGILSDADLSFGSSTFGTDQTLAIQTILNTASASNPLTVYWDVKASVKGLRIKSHTTIIASPNSGALLRDNSDSAILSNYNSAPGTIADSNITIIGGIWNCNGYRGGVAKQQHSSVSYGFRVGIRMYGVKKVIMENVTILNTRTYACLFFTAEDVIVKNMVIDQGDDPQINQDGLDFDGYENNILVDGLRARCGDDALALNSTMLLNGIDAGDYTLYFDHFGPITNVDLRNLYFDDSDMGIRMLSGNQLIDNINIRNLSGNCHNYWLVIDNYLQNPAGVDDAGPGNIGRVKIENIAVTTGTPTIGNYAKASINCNVDYVEIGNYGRRDFAVNNLPSFMVAGTNTVVKNLVFTNYNAYDSTSSSTINHIVIDDATVENLEFNGTVHRQVSSNNSPIIKLVDSATVTQLSFNGVRARNINNILDVVGSTLDYLSATNVRHTGQDSAQASFKTDTDVDDIVLSNYYGYNQTSGTFIKERGDGFDVGGLPNFPGVTLAASWKLDESSGNAADAAGNSYTMTNTGTVTYSAGKINNAANFTGANYLTSTPSFSHSTFTINAWVYIPSFTGIQMLISNEAHAASQYGISLYTNGPTVADKLILSVGTGAAHSDYTVNTSLSINTWYMFTVVYTPNLAKVYVNGSLILNQATSYATLGGNANNYLRLGANGHTSPQYPFTGSIDNVSIWNIALTAGNVTTLYNSGTGIQHPFPF